MRSHKQSIFLILGALLPISLGFGSLANPFDLQPESRLWINGTSSVRAFECRATGFDVKVESVVSGAAAAVLDGQKGVGVAKVTVPTDRLECGNGTMNGHMRKALKAPENPQIAFELESYDLSKSGDTVRATLTGTLTIGGVTKPATVAAAASAEGASLRITGSHEVRMSEFGLKAPSLMFGTMKVGDKVKVGFDILLKDHAE